MLNGGGHVMQPPLFWRGLRPAYTVSLLQLLIGLFVVCLWWLKAPFAAYSAGLGVLIAVIPQFFFAKKAFAKQGARAARQIMNAFYAGEATKWALTFLLFAIVFIKTKPDGIALISSFAITQIAAPFFALLVIKNNQG
jgi:ATP synthase protein I